MVSCYIKESIFPVGGGVINAELCVLSRSLLCLPSFPEVIPAHSTHLIPRAGASLTFSLLACSSEPQPSSCWGEAACSSLRTEKPASSSSTFRGNVQPLPKVPAPFPRCGAAGIQGHSCCTEPTELKYILSSVGRTGCPKPPTQKMWMCLKKMGMALGVMV